MDTLLERFFAGEPRALARIITRVENRSPGSFELLRELFPHTGRAQVIGVTGSPGAGKSSLVDRLSGVYRRRGNSIGIVAVDPSSPFTGGAILGDRIRIQSPGVDPAVFIRSMATRGRLGGLSAAAADVVSVMDAAGRNPILVETVGVGQDEIDIVKLADVTVVVLVPGMGDDVQALKAGIMEIGDVFVINKCDRPGVEKMERAISAMLSLAQREDRLTPEIVRTTATKGEGVEELAAAIERRLTDAENAESRMKRKREAARQRIVMLLEERLVGYALDSAYPGGELSRVIDDVAAGKQDPYSIVERIVRNARFRPANEV